MSAHAVLSPSGASRWLSCTPSARLEEQFPDSAGTAALEGTLAHSLGELLIKFKSKIVTRTEYARALAKIHADGLYEHAMFEHVEGYAVFVLEALSKSRSHTKDALLFLEQKLDLTEYVPEGFGTGDVIIIADKVLKIIDLKYGKGVPVSAVGNSQMRLYALGALRQFSMLYDIQEVEMTIYQPRLDSVTTDQMTTVDLFNWANDFLIPRASLAFAGEGEFAPGEHCRFCKAKAVCRANAEYNLELAKHDFKPSNLLTDAEISEIMDRADRFTKWISAVEEHALNEAVNNGKKWPGYKLVEGRSNRAFTNEEKVAETLLAEGFKEDQLYTKKLIGITAVEKEVGKDEFKKLLEPYVVKPPGKPTLVPDTDKRPEYHSADAAAKDFIEN